MAAFAADWSGVVGRISLGLSKTISRRDGGMQAASAAFSQPGPLSLHRRGPREPTATEAAGEGVVAAGEQPGGGGRRVGSARDGHGEVYDLDHIRDQHHHEQNRQRRGCRRRTGRGQHGERRREEGRVG